MWKESSGAQWVLEPLKGEGKLSGEELYLLV